MRGALLAAFAMVLAGCSQAAPFQATASGPLVEGWVLDLALTPIAGASVTVAGTAIGVRTDAAGHFILEAPSGTDLVVTVAADGFGSTSQAISALSGTRHVLNFTLERIPAAAPYHVVERFSGFLQCAVTAVVMEDQSSPHEHQGVRCSSLVNDTRNVWHGDIPAETTGLIIETQWTPNSELAQGLVMKIVVDGSGDVIGFVEGRSILRIQLSQTNLQRNLQAGFTHYTVTIDAGAGTGEHEHGAIGVFLEQPFTLFATSFFNGPVDPAYSVAEGP